MSFGFFVFSGRFVPLDVCPFGHLFLQTFCLMDLMSLDVISPDVLVSGLFVSGRFVWAPYSRAVADRRNSVTDTAESTSRCNRNCKVMLLNFDSEYSCFAMLLTLQIHAPQCQYLCWVMLLNIIDSAKLCFSVSWPLQSHSSSTLWNSRVLLLNASVFILLRYAPHCHWLCRVLLLTVTDSAESCSSMSLTLRSHAP
jgi:hypothetical protein